jgi:dihydroflavonol-4-reductase
MPFDPNFALSGRKVLVTGGNGFIGSVVVRTLTNSGAQVRCLLRPTSKVDRLAGLTYERAQGDVCDVPSVRQAMTGCEAVIHLAGLSSWDLIDSPAMKEVTEGGTRNLLVAARESGLRKFVFVSSASAVNASDEPKVFDETATFTLQNSGLNYAIHKHAAEQLCLGFHAEGVPVVIVNPTEVYGPNDTALVTAGNLLDFAKSSPVTVCPGGGSIGHVDDVALGTVRALERGRPGERYILGGENVTWKELAALTIELLGQRKRIVTMPTGLIRTLAKGAKALHIPLPFNPRVIPYATRYWFMNSAKAVRELGVTFRQPRDVLGPTLAWLKEAGHIKDGLVNAGQAR